MSKPFSGKSIAAALGALLLLSACAPQQAGPVTLDPSTPVSIEIWHYYNGPQKLAFDELVAHFNETVGQEQGIVVEAFGQGNVNELFQNIHDAVNNKVGASEVPAIFAAYTDTVYDLDQRNMVAAFDRYFTEQELSEYVDAYIAEGRFDEAGSLEIIPTAKATEILMVNKTDWDRFAAETGAQLASLQTIEGLVEISKAYYLWTDAQTPDVPDDGKAMFGRDAMANYIILGYHQLTGGSLFDRQDGKITFEPDAAAFRKLWDNYYIPYINGWFGAYGRFRSDDAKTGDIIALVGSTSGAYYFPGKVTLADDTTYPIESAVFPAPCFAGCAPSAIQQGAGMALIASDPQTELAATTFLKWFTDVDRAIGFTVSSAYLPVKKAANDMDRIRADAGYRALPPAVQEAIAVSVDVVNTYELYFEQAFFGSSAARQIMERSLASRAEADREQILTLVENGMPLSEAVAKFATDES
ncbi:MAG: extracellular solute-binding protein, partial [Candidatus Pelethousia sp.]|nr:extracellular solute-binding protein [Candidatus Pelethousia sp.]